MTDTNKDFTPDWALIPGESILDAMEERGWTQAQLAERLAYKEEKVGDLINGEISITNDVAIRLANALGGTADFWLNLESNYQKHKARLQSQALGAQVRARADELGVSVEALADALGLEVAQVEALLADELPLNTQIARGLARALKTCAGYWWAIEKGGVQ